MGFFRFRKSFKIAPGVRLNVSKSGSGISWIHRSPSGCAFTKSEKLSAEIEAKEIEIAALRSGALTAMISRQTALDKRRIEAVEQIWGAVTLMAPAKSASALVASLKFEESAKEAARNPKFREIFFIFPGADPQKFSTGTTPSAKSGRVYNSLIIRCKAGAA